jgi:hypothetical protein
MNLEPPKQLKKFNCRVLHISQKNAWCPSLKALTSMAEEMKVNIEFDEVGYSYDLSHIKLGKIDAVLVSAYNKCDSVKLGAFLNTCIQNGINVVLTVYANSSKSTYPESFF